jgi:hypothetical protein
MVISLLVSLRSVRVAFSGAFEVGLADDSGNGFGNVSIRIV